MKAFASGKPWLLALREEGLWSTVKKNSSFGMELGNDWDKWRIKTRRFACCESWKSRECWEVAEEADIQEISQ